jgi:hypothetical protein
VFHSCNVKTQICVTRPQCVKQPAVPKAAAELLSIWEDVGDPILDMRSDYTIPVYHYSKILYVKIDRDYWRNKNPVFPEEAVIWFTDGSRAS